MRIAAYLTVEEIDALLTQAVHGAVGSDGLPSELASARVALRRARTALPTAPALDDADPETGR